MPVPHGPEGALKGSRQPPATVGGPRRLSGALEGPREALETVGGFRELWGFLEGSREVPGAVGGPRQHEQTLCACSSIHCITQEMKVLEPW